MNRRFFKLAVMLCVLALLFGTMATFTRAQAKKAEPPRAAVKEWQEALELWNDVGRKLTAMAEDMPEDKYWYQPTKEMRPFGEVLLHVAGVNYQIINAVAGREIGKGENDPPRARYGNKAAVVAFIKKVFADGATQLKGIQSHEVFEKPVKDPWDNRLVHPHTLWGVAVAHSAEHYGNLVPYYRIQGMVPPESRPRK